ncbi:MAG TPA: hypothetical protein VG099_32460, partial [Gemmataceae bacterium]|nr:hypothetical protein [Gemmataceae bacterium]
MLSLLRLVAVLAICGAVLDAQAQAPAVLKPFVKEDAPVLVLEHVRVIDGTGSAAIEDQRLVIDHGKITSVGPATGAALQPGAKVLDMTGKTVFPGLVGMHEHLFYPTEDGRPGLQQMYGEAADTAPRLYLAGGVTSARTAGS